MNYWIFNVRTDVNARDCSRGCTDTVRISAMKVDSGRKISRRSGELNLPQRGAGPTLYQLNYIPTPLMLGNNSVHVQLGRLKSLFLVTCGHFVCANWWLFPRVRGLRGKGWTIHSPPALFLLLLLLFWVVSLRTPIPLYRSGSLHSGSASRDDCGRVFPDELRVSSFPCWVPTVCLEGIDGISLGQGCMRV